MNLVFLPAFAMEFAARYNRNPAKYTTCRRGSLVHQPAATPRLSESPAQVFESVRIERERAQPPSDRGADCIGNRGRNRGGSDFAYATWSLRARHNVDLGGVSSILRGE